MAGTTSDDVHNDPENILADTDNSVDGAVELPKSETDNPSQSIFVPERGEDVRGRIDELEGTDSGDAHDEMSDGHPEDMDTDSNHLSDNEPADEQDGTEV